MSETTRFSPPGGVGRRRGGIGTENHRSSRYGQRELNPAEPVFERGIGLEPPAEAAVELLGTIDVRNGYDNDLELHELRIWASLVKFIMIVSLAAQWNPSALTAYGRPRNGQPVQHLTVTPARMPDLKMCLAYLEIKPLMLTPDKRRMASWHSYIDMTRFFRRSNGKLHPNIGNVRRVIWVTRTRHEALGPR